MFAKIEPTPGWDDHRGPTVQGFCRVGIPTRRIRGYQPWLVRVWSGQCLKAAVQLLGISRSKPLRKTRYPLQRGRCSAPGERDTAEGRLPPGGAFDCRNRLDEDRRVKLPFDSQRATEVEWRHADDIEARHLQDRVDVLDRLNGLDQRAARDVGTPPRPNTQEATFRTESARVNGPRPLHAVRRMHQLLTARCTPPSRPDERIDNAFRPRVQGHFHLSFVDGRHAYERRASRTGGSGDHRVHRFAADRPVLAIDHDEVGPRGGDRLRRDGDGITHITPRRTALSRLNRSLKNMARASQDRDRRSQAAAPCRAAPEPHVRFWRRWSLASSPNSAGVQARSARGSLHFVLPTRSTVLPSAVRACVFSHVVPTRFARSRCGSGGGDDDIVAGRTVDRVVAVAADEHVVAVAADDTDAHTPLRSMRGAGVDVVAAGAQSGRSGSGFSFTVSGLRPATALSRPGCSADPRTPRPDGPRPSRRSSAPAPGVRPGPPIGGVRWLDDVVVDRDDGVPDLPGGRFGEEQLVHDCHRCSLPFTSCHIANHIGVSHLRVTGLRVTLQHNMCHDARL